MFLTKYDLISVVELYQIEEYTQGDDKILNMAVNAAIEEVGGYLSRFDTGAIFSAKGEERSPLVLELTKTITLYYMSQKSNVDIIYGNMIARYEQATKRLADIKNGIIELNLPLKPTSL